MVGAAAERPLGESSDIAARMAGPVGGRASARPCRCHLRYGRAHRPDERTWRREVISGEDHPIGGGIRSPLGKEPFDAPRLLTAPEGLRMIPTFCRCPTIRGWRSR